MFISVVVPIYNSEENIFNLYSRLSNTLKKCQYDYEIIMVDDCGPDGSWQKIEQLCSQSNHVKGIKLTKNFGQHAATLCGISNALGDWIVTIDDDLEQHPEDIPNLIDNAQSGYDLVYGCFPQRTHARWRNWTSQIARKLFTFAIPNLNKEYTSFRVIKKDIALKLLNFTSPFPFIDGYLSWITNNYSCVLVEHGARYDKSSNYDFWKLFKHTMNIFITFSDMPLKISTWIGLCFSLVGFIMSVIIFMGKLFGFITVSGYTSAMVGFLIFGGIQLMMLGIMGEYIGRINFKTSQKPLFLVSQVIKGAQKFQEKS
jgi:glycosyltransferase involved in cell wall biosynthesis